MKRLHATQLHVNLLYTILWVVSKLTRKLTAGTIIKGLYAAGEVAGGLHAGNRLGGNSLTDIFTFGCIAADTAIQEHC